MEDFETSDHAELDDIPLESDEDSAELLDVPVESDADGDVVSASPSTDAGNGEETGSEDWFPESNLPDIGGDEGTSSVDQPQEGDRPAADGGGEEAGPADARSSEGPGEIDQTRDDDKSSKEAEETEQPKEVNQEQPLEEGEAKKVETISDHKENSLDPEVQKELDTLQGKPCTELKAAVKEMKEQGQIGKDEEIEVHHLIEQRFIAQLQETYGKDYKVGDIPGVALEKKDHQEITDRWLKEIGRRNMKEELRTDTAKIEDLDRAARNVYTDKYTYLLNDALRVLGK